MRRTPIILALLLFAGVAMAQPPASAPASRPADFAADIQQLRAEIDALRKENAELKAEVAKLKPKPAAPANSITVGMTMAQAEKVCRKQGWRFQRERSETLENGETIFREVWVFQEGPRKAYFENEIVTRVER